MSQVQVVYSHLRNHGYITQLIASNYGVRSLSSRICELKRAGVQIESSLKKDDMGVRYAYHTLAQTK